MDKSEDHKKIFCSLDSLMLIIELKYKGGGDTYDTQNEFDKFDSKNLEIDA